MPVVLGVVLTLSVAGVWHELLQEELQAGLQSSLPNVILFGGVIGAWTLAFTVYLGQRSERSVQQTRKINRQLQQENIERQRIESELRRSEASIRNLTDRLELAAQSGGIGIWDWDIINNSLVWNEQMYRLYGLNSSDFSGAYEAWSSALHPDDFEKTTTTIWQAVRGEGDYKPEFRVVHPDGTVRYIQAYAVVQRDEQKQAQRMIGVNLDITDRKQAELVLQESESTLRSFFNSEAMLMGIVELHGHDILHLADNQTTATFFGTTPAAMKNRFASELGIPKLDLERWIQAYQEAARTNTPVHFEYLHQTSTGQHWLTASVCQIANDSNHYPRFSYIVEDITPRKQAELALQNALTRSQMLFNTSIDGIVVINHQGDVMQTSPSFAQMLGYTVEETLKLNMADWEAQWTQEELQQIRNGGVLPPVFETRHRRKDGSIYDVEISYNRAELAGEMIHFCICRDISERKRSEAERKRTEIALQNSQARFAGILEIANDAIISINAEQQITLFNKGAERIFGYTAKEVLGQPLSLLMPDRFAQAHGYHINQYTHNGSQARPMSQRGAIFGRRKDGTEFPAEASISKLTLEGETIFTTFLRDITERKQAELALQQSEARYRRIIQTAYEGIWTIDAENLTSFVNPRMAEMLGYPAEEMIGQSLFAFMTEENKVLAQNHLNQRRHGLSEQHEFQFQRQDGLSLWVLVSASPITDEAGRYAGAIAMMTDISERKRIEDERQQAELARQKSEARFQAFMNHSPALAWITDTEGVMVYANQTYLNALQLPTSDLVGKSLFELYPLDAAQQFLNNIQAAAHTQQMIEAIELAPRQDGTIGNFLVYKFPIPDPSGQRLVGGIAIDVTQQRQAEEELRHQKEMFQTIVDNIPVMIALFNDHGRIDFINPEFERTLGWSLEEWQQRDVMIDLYPDPIERQSVLDHMTAAMGNWKDFTTLTATNQHLETTWTNVPISRGRFLGIGQDISDRKHKEAALQQAMEAAEAANLAKSAFLANMSHELRTPLNVILGFAQVMAHDPSLTPGQQEDLQTIQRSGDHLLNLINDVLDLSKIEAGHFSLEETSFDLIALLHTLRTMMMERARAKQLQLIFDIAPKVPQFVMADEQKIRQVLLNLLSNAIKFTKQGSVTLQVTSQESQERVCSLCSPAQHGCDLVSSSAHTLQFAVIDTGAGIATTEQNTIFEAFVQAEAGRKSFTGTGLGLTISRKLLEIMNGEISVHSIPQVGSTFIVTVPVCPTSSVEVRLAQPDRTVIGLMPGQPHRRILVVDDQSENRQLMVRLLTQLGLEVREATNGQEAIDIWQAWKPDLTWMDIRMPGLDGYEATKQIRAMEQQTSVIIALTAQASHSDRTLALAAGCNDYISKPFREETVFLKMTEYLGLQYVYAEPEVSQTPAATLSRIDNAELHNLDRALLAHIPQDWFHALEDAALGGYDGEIVNLTTQLPPELKPLGNYLADLADNFQFEQILDWLYNDARRGGDDGPT